MKKQKFQKELNYIKSSDIREFCETAIENLPDYFFTVPASSSGKFHPTYALGKGGLVRHTKAAVRIANHLLELEQNKKAFTGRERDLILTALILHDGWKQGTHKPTHTVHEHPNICADWIKRDSIFDTLLNEEERGLIASAIASHMGEWNAGRGGEVKLNKPETEMEKFVHMCDFLASRKDIEIMFTQEEIVHTANIKEYVFPFGKHKGLKLTEVAKNDPSYIAWAKKNIDKEPLKTLLTQL